jgi:hypothetical protein
MKKTAKYYSANDKKYKFIYQTKNNINGKTYIGYHCTNNLGDGYIGCGCRSQSYAVSSKKYGFKSAFLDAVIKYGYSNFERKILSFYDTIEECIEEEKFIVDEKWVKSNNNYNISLGGNGGTLNKKLSKEDEDNLFFDFMIGIKKRQLCEKYNVSKSVIYKVTKDKDTSNRIKPIQENILKIKEWIEKESDYYIKQYKENKMNKSEINKEIFFDLYRNDFLKNIVKDYKYVAIKNDNVFYFSDTKDLRKIPGFEKLSLSYVRNAINKKSSNCLDYKILHLKDFNDGVKSYREEFVIETKYNGIVFEKNNTEYVVEKNLNIFAKKHNLHHGALVDVIKGKTTQHKGFKIKKQ